MQLQPHERIIVAYDRNNLDIPLITSFQGRVGGIKTGPQTFTAEDDDHLTPIGFLMRPLAKRLGLFVFEDWKFADGPDAVGAAVANVARRDAWGITVKCDAGIPTLRAAVANRGRSNIIGVTVLTTLDEKGCRRVFNGDPNEKVADFTDMLVECGAQGVVCSPLEVEMVREISDDALIYITPGIRFPDSRPDEQQRKATPYQAILAGVDYLVIGELIMKAEKPLEAIEIIASSIAEAVKDRGY